MERFLCQHLGTTGSWGHCHQQCPSPAHGAASRFAKLAVQAVPGHGKVRLSGDSDEPTAVGRRPPGGTRAVTTENTPAEERALGTPNSKQLNNVY